MISIAIKNGILFILIILIIHFFIKNQTLEKFNVSGFAPSSLTENDKNDDSSSDSSSSSGDDDEKHLLEFIQKEDNKMTVDIVQDVLDNIGPNNTTLPRTLLDTKPTELLQDLGTFGGGNNGGGLSYSPYK
jgi:hypothetical protein